MIKRSTFALLLVALVAGCSDPEPESVAPTNATTEQTAPPATASPSLDPAPSPTAEPSAVSNVADVELPPAEEVGADEQMLDDASATGMTARAERDREEPEPLPANAQEQ